VWGRWIAQCGGTRKQLRWTIQSVPLLQEVVSYAVKQYCLKVEEIGYLKIVTCIIEMIYYWLYIRF
jgi:hypothetical protein